MNYRTAKILAETNLTPAGTKTIDINVADIISRITIAWRVTKALHAMSAPGCNDISKIELVDGSEVLHSLKGGQNQALCIYDRKCPTMSHGQHLASNSEYNLFGLDFGRFLFDPQLALDPKQFRNLQLKITYDFAVADTSATLGYLEVWADCFDEKVVSPVGMLIAKEHYDYTISAASAYEYIDLPTDRVLRKILIQGYALGYEPWYQLAEAKLDEDNEKRIPFDWDLEDYYRVMKGIWRPVQEQFEGQPGASGSIYYLTPTDYYTALVMTAPSIQSYGYSTSGWFKGGKVTLKGNGGNVALSGIAFGWLPNHCWEFPFGDPMDLADWYDITKLGSLKLRLKSGSATSGNGRVILQQLRRY